MSPLSPPSSGPGSSSGQVLVASSPVTVSSAQLLALDVTPITLVAAAGANTVLVPLGGAVRYKATATPYVVGGNSLAIANQGNAANFPGTGIQDPFVGFAMVGLLDQTADRFSANAAAGGFAGAAALTLFSNQALVIQANGAPTGGTGTLVVVAYYVTLALT